MRHLTSPKHICSLPCGDERDELDNVTAKVSLWRAQVRATQGLRRPRFSFFLFNFQTAKQSRKHPDSETSSARPFSRVAFGPRNSRETPASATLGRRRQRRLVISPARTDCQLGFEKIAAHRAGRHWMKPSRDAIDMWVRGAAHSRATAWNEEKKLPEDQCANACASGS
jgi:hypothetical protein